MLIRLQERTRQLQERIRLLEEEMAALWGDVEQVTRALDRPVATFVVDGEEITITEKELAIVRDQLTRPRSDEVVKVLALADRIGEQRRHLPPEEQKRLFWENVEAIRAQAIADGTAIDDPMEAVVGD
jgi:septal ring factor EnvC (AmiA/AmiB activator)